MQMDFEQACRQLLRALRANRSQTGFSRRLGFRSNVAAKWESGQRMPTALESLSYSARLGVDVPAMLQRFQPNVKVEQRGGSVNLQRWLSDQRGAQRLADLADKSQLSRYSVGRFLAGQTQPRLPQFLRLVEALTGRADELVDVWVGIEQVPALRQRFSQTQAARRAIVHRPMCLAVLCLLDTQSLRTQSSAEQQATLARLLECSTREVSESLELLAAGGVITHSEAGYLPTATLTVDARPHRARHLDLQAYWATLAADRSRAPAPSDVCSYNVFSIGRQDYDKLRQLQREFYRTARALIAASEPTELAGLLLVQMIAWDPDVTV